MHTTFFFSALVALAIIYIPGFAFLKILRRSTILSLVAAPMVTVFLLEVLAVLYDKFDIAFNVLTILPGVLVFYILLILAMLLVRHFRGGWPLIDGGSYVFEASFINVLTIAAYLLVSLCVYFLVVYFSVDTHDGYVQAYDNVAHLGYIRSFINTEHMSLLRTSYYLDVDPAFTPVAGTIGGFYPSGWHMLIALTSLAANVSELVAMNAVNLIFMVPVYCLGCFALLKSVFTDKWVPVLAGAIFPLAAVAFPWIQYMQGGYDAYLAGCYAIPGLCAVFAAIFSDKTIRPLAIVTFVIGCMGAACIHTSAIFGLSIFCLFYLCRWIYVSGFANLSRRNRVFIVAGVVVLFCIVWCGVRLLPALSSTTTYSRAITSTPTTTLDKVLTFSFDSGESQLLLSVLIIAGCVYFLFCAHSVWPVLLCLASFAAYFVIDCVPGDLRQILGGYWYVEPIRFEAICVVYSVPVLAAGTVLPATALRLIAKEKKWSDAVHIVVAAVTTLVVALAVFRVNDVDVRKGSIINEYDASAKTPFDEVKARLNWAFDNDAGSILTSNELEFLDKVAEIVPQGALILNDPTDGSAYLYGAEGWNLYYRREVTTAYDIYGSTLIRLNLDHIDRYMTLQDYLKEIGAQYVLLLDKPQDDDGLTTRFHTYGTGFYYHGLNSISEDSSGLELVLKQDDMELYKVL